MNLIVNYLTNNDCYKQNKKITPQGIMVHSTATPGVMAASWVQRWNKPGVEKAVHAFVDNLCVVQTLPWTMRGWHAGGSANNTHIGFEICEPAGFSYSGGSTMVGYDPVKQKPYFDAIWANSVELCVMLCKEFNLTEKNIICHSEGYKLGVSSNHADVMHWFPKHGKNMDDFRKDVKAALGSTEPSPQPPPVSPASLPILKRGSKGDDVKNMQSRLCAKGYILTIDGMFGLDTEQKVKAYQKNNALVVDGICGPRTWEKLLK